MQKYIYLLVPLTLLCVFLTSCEKAREKLSLTTPSLAEQVKTQPDSLSLIPENSLGFFMWDTTRAPFKRLSNSPWGKMTLWSLLKRINPKSSKRIDELKELNLDITSPEFSTRFQSLVVSLSPSSKDPKELAMLAVLDAKSDALAQELESNLRGFLERKQFSFAEEQIGELRGLKIGTWRGPLSPSHFGYPTIFFAIGDSQVFFSSEKSLIARASTNNKTSVPTILSNKSFEALTADFPNLSRSYAYGFVDFEGSKLGSREQNPFDSIAWALAMEDAPVSFLKTKLKHGHRITNSLDESLKSKRNILNSSAKSPMGSVAMSGSLVQLLVSLNPVNIKEADFLKSVDGIIVSASIAPFGQSILPLPAISAHLKNQSSEPIERLMNSSLFFKMPGSSSLQEKTIKDWKVRYAHNPLALSSYVTHKGQDILIATNEKSLAELIDSVENQRPSGVPDSKNLANLKVNFENVARYLESLGGMLAMFAPKLPEQTKLLTPALLEQVRGMGRYTGSVSYRDKTISFQSRYDRD